ncbi:MAG: Rdx family protein [Planctomycetota bacterium]
MEFCVAGNYERIARRLASAIESEFSIDVALIPSRGGVLEVSVGGRLIFSKKANRRFPEADEVAYHVRAWVASQKA